MALQIILLVVLILLSGFFSGSEVALLSVTTVRVRMLVKEKRVGSSALARLKARPRRMIITILIGNNVVNISAASLVAVMTAEKFGSNNLGIAAGVLTLVILIFGEITPKTLASKYSGTIALWVARLIEALYIILYPLVVFLDWLTKIIEGGIKLKQQPPVTEAEIKTMVEYGVEHNVVAPEEQYIINRALAFSDISARNIMIPIEEVFTLEHNEQIKDALPQIIQSGYSRIPIHEGKRENIVGIAMIKDVARELTINSGKKIIKDITVSTTFVPENIRIDYLFKIFQKKRKHMAMVYDSNKRTVGIVTLEDLIEELVGEIVDESDVENK